MTRQFAFFTLLTIPLLGCGDSAEMTTDEPNDISAYVSENPSPTIEELQGQEAEAAKVNAEEL